MILFISIMIYLLIGFYFKKPEEWNLATKILVHIFWLPIILFLIIIIRFIGVKIM
ncbi:hypothetical protein SUNDANCE_46 [Brevibacillus phage Sundance]|uniref:hypothetical protein n=1 Tax=Brevibacillus phage Sundance TaxID=1691958 RepID=UPI0006BD6677|nr:hypothetical protein AVT09_gp046 [Brevibacillus phage Sundance]ALA47862.1 hypothetical protein SUNDANCE_46 [Brevibacillus phage Sundance]